MANIKYICLSDMHLGEEDSILTNIEDASTVDPAQPSQVMIRLVECLKQLISDNSTSNKPTLILNGDILELALSKTNTALMVFERFIEQILSPENMLFEKIIYIPGNHDHHVWELARETQYLNHISKNLTTPPKPLPDPWHTTNMFIENDPDPVPSHLLSAPLHRHHHLKSYQIDIAYPNFGLYHEVDQKCVIFHHGHFAEILYRIMTELRNKLFINRQEPDTVWDLEAENFAWIDFFWSTMGRSGEVGQDIEVIYESMRDKKQIHKLLSNLCTNLAKDYDLPGWGDAMESRLLKWIVTIVVESVTKREREKVDSCLSNETSKGLSFYMNKLLKAQILNERKQVSLNNVTFVLGHTHKPFQEDMIFNEYPQWVNVYNTGGWVVDSVEPQPLHGGAIVLLDENLNAISLRMYNENIDPELYTVTVKESLHTGETQSPFYSQIYESIEGSRKVWKDFSIVTSETVHERARNLRARISSRT